MSVGQSKFGHVWAKLGKCGQVWMSQTDQQGWVIYLVDVSVCVCVCVCRSRSQCEVVGKFRHMWGNVSRFGYARPIHQDE